MCIKVKAHSESIKAKTHIILVPPHASHACMWKPYMYPHVMHVLKECHHMPVEVAEMRIVFSLRPLKKKK